MPNGAFDKLLNYLLDLPNEVECVEFKHSNDQPQLIGEYISALANAAVIQRQEKAYMVWGIEDGTKKVLGTKFNPATAKQGNQAIEMWLSQKLKPTPHFEFACAEYKNKQVVVLTIFPIKTEPVKFDGEAFIRVGSHKTKLDNQPGKLKEFWSQVIAGDSGSWDERKEDSSETSDLDKDLIREFLERLRQSGQRNLPTLADELAVLEKLRLIVEGKPTRAAILLMCKEPNRFYSTAFIKAGRFKTDTVILDAKEFKGTLFEQIDLSMTWLQERMTKGFIISGSAMSGKDKVGSVERVEDWQYPLASLREAIINAVCHRDYMVSSPVNIRLFDDRLEIWNPGSLPSDLSPEALLKAHPSHPPNKLIAECFFSARLIEGWGTGTLRIAKELENHNQPPPVFDTSSTNNTFKVIMFATGYSDPELIEMGLNARQISAIRFLQTHKTITNAQYQELFEASKPTASRDMADLVKQKLVSKIGITGKGTSYVLAERKA